MNFTQARFNMVESQIRPNRITSPELLAAFHKVPREMFVPSPAQGFCYSDHSIALSPTRSLLDPLLLARLIDAANLSPQDTVLDIGSNTGYASAVLSSLCKAVIALESDQAFSHQAQVLLKSLNITNVSLMVGDLPMGAPLKAPFDVILVEGMVGHIPQPLFDQLQDTGRVVAVHHTAHGLGQLKVWQKIDGKIYARVVLDTAAPWLSEFSVEKQFVF